MEKLTAYCAVMKIHVKVNGKFHLKTGHEDPEGK
jgi:hypothetical protein